MQGVPGLSEETIVGGGGAIATKAGIEPGFLVTPDKKVARTREEVSWGIQGKKALLRENLEGQGKMMSISSRNSSGATVWEIPI